MSKVAPTGEQGSATGIPLLGLLSWAQMGASSWGNDMEYVPELMWPNSIRTYQMMRNDAQVDGLYRGATMPLTMWDYGIDPNGADPLAVQELSRDTGLPIAERTSGVDVESFRIDQSQPIPRSRTRFDFVEHLEQALLAPAYGNYYFEQVADLVPPPAGWAIDTPERARLWKLAERPPWTITEINTDASQDGGLSSIKQWSTPINDPGIDVSRLLAYVWQKEGANWTGRSMLRSCFRPWIVKDRVMRVGSINIERNGAGVPIVSAPPGATKSQIAALNSLAMRIKAGENAGGAIPDGASISLLGIMGSQPDAVGMMKFLNEEMARAFLEMFQGLGTTSSAGLNGGSMAATFLDFFEWALEAIARWFVRIFNKHVIRDWMAWNFPESADPNVDEFDPRLIYIKKGSSTAPLAQQVQDGNVEMDPTTQARVFEGEILRDSSRPGSGHRAAAARRTARTAAGSSDTLPLSLPARPLRRAPYAHEVAAAVDYAALDSAHASATELIVMEVAQYRRTQISELHDAIVAAGGDLDVLSEIEAEPRAASVIASRLQMVADLAVGEAVTEAGRQGRSIDSPASDDLRTSIEARAAVIDRILTRDVVGAAVRRAVRLTGGALDSVGVASQVADELNGMTWVSARDQLTGAITQAQNLGRGLVFRRSDPTDIYASELLDSNTCTNCVSKDGTHYQSMDDAEQDYPTGGYKECLGREKCRGLLVAVYSETPALV